MGKEYLIQKNVDFINEFVRDKYKVDGEKGEVYSYRTGKNMGHKNNRDKKDNEFIYVSITYEKGKVKIIPRRNIIGVIVMGADVGDKIIHKNGNTLDDSVENLEVVKRFSYEIKGDVAEINLYNSNIKAIIDKEDIDLVKDYIWLYDKDGYVTCKGDGETSRRMHRLIADCPKHLFVDHINRVRYDNRRCNLRYADTTENAINKSMMGNNKSGVSGVCYDKSRNKWIGKIGIGNRKTIGKRFSTKEDAIKYRLQLEKEYFGDYAPQKHLFEQYGIVLNQ